MQHHVSSLKIRKLRRCTQCWPSVSIKHWTNTLLARNLLGGVSLDVWSVTCCSELLARCNRYTQLWFWRTKRLLILFTIYCFVHFNQNSCGLNHGMCCICNEWIIESVLGLLICCGFKYFIFFSFRPTDPKIYDFCPRNIRFSWSGLIPTCRYDGLYTNFMSEVLGNKLSKTSSSPISDCSV